VWCFCVFEREESACFVVVVRFFGVVSVVCSIVRFQKSDKVLTITKVLSSDTHVEHSARKDKMWGRIPHAGAS